MYIEIRNSYITLLYTVIAMPHSVSSLRPAPNDIALVLCFLGDQKKWCGVVGQGSVYMMCVGVSNVRRCLFMVSVFSFHLNIIYPLPHGLLTIQLLANDRYQCNWAPGFKLKGWRVPSFGSAWSSQTPPELWHLQQTRNLELGHLVCN